MTPATTDEIAEVLGGNVDESVIERLAAVEASLDEIGEAIDDVDYERRYGESREASSQRVAEVRTILQQLPAPEADASDSDSADELEGLSIVDRDELEHAVS